MWDYLLFDDPALSADKTALEKSIGYDAVTGQLASYTWEVGFSYPDSWDVAERHIRDLLASNSFLIETHSYVKGSSIWAWSTDGAYAIHLFRLERDGKEVGYSLEVINYLKPVKWDDSRLSPP